LVALLQAANAKSATITGLNEFIISTQTFGDLNLKAFVKLAETGRTPAATASPTRSLGKQTVDTNALAADIVNLYQRAAQQEVTEEQIKVACSRLSSLKKDSLLKLAEEIGLLGMGSKSIKIIVAAITSRLLDRKGAAIRGQLIARPETHQGTLPPT
jgi:Glu-tRNA(Gln) amidotransferase subunit E-like FAD-binding protein